jgi:hypothetical protein
MRNPKYRAQYAWKARNKKKVRKIQQIWRASNRDKVRDYDRQYYLSHGDEIREKHNRRIKKLRKENPEIFRSRDKAYYQANQEKVAAGRQASEIRRVIFILTGKSIQKGMDIGSLYDSMVSTIKKTSLKAANKFPFGRPDALIFKTEWKFGLDRLRSNQFVWNVLNGFDCKVRWASSCDVFEDSFNGHKNKSRLFNSYREFVVWEYGIHHAKNE